MQIEKVDFSEASKQQRLITNAGNHNICTKFCNGRFLQYHDIEPAKELVSSFILGEIDNQRFIFPYSQSRNSSNKVSSHLGSPYAGLCMNTDHPDTIKRTYQECVKFIKQELDDIEEIEIRLPPAILNVTSAAHEWALWSLGFEPTTMYFGRYFEMNIENSLNRNRKRRISRIDSSSMTIQSSSIPSLEVFNVILSNRQIRHSVKPTHELSDFEKIENLLPGTIKTYYVIHNDKICSVAIIFEDLSFSTIQYLGGLECSFDCGSQDILVQRIVDTYTKMSQKLLFGTSTEPSEGHRVLNKGLDLYKESFGSIGYTSTRMTFRFS